MFSTQYLIRNLIFVLFTVHNEKLKPLHLLTFQPVTDQWSRIRGATSPVFTGGEASPLQTLEGYDIIIINSLNTKAIIKSIKTHCMNITFTSCS